MGGSYRRLVELAKWAEDFWRTSNRQTLFEEEHQEVLARRGAKRDMSAAEYGAFLDSKAVPHGTAEQASNAITAMASWGVGRFYVQDISPLDEVNLEYLSMVFGALLNS